MEKTYSLHLQEILGCRNPYHEAPSAQVCADVNARGAGMIPGFLNVVVQVRKFCWINVLQSGIKACRIFTQVKVIILFKQLNSALVS